MRAAGLLAIALFGCGDPDVVVDDVRIPVSLVNPTKGGTCLATDFEATRSVLVELHHPLGDIGRCVLVRSCMDTEEGSLANLSDLQSLLHDEGIFFEGLPAYENVFVHLRALARPGCEQGPAEDPLACGFSNTTSLDGDEASFTVSVSCALDAATCPPAPPCSDADL